MSAAAAELARAIEGDPRETCRNCMYAGTLWQNTMCRRPGHLYVYCIHERTSDDRRCCGPEARYFKERPCNQPSSS